jgi:formylglycine-generating enzyme required for sulfatase activity
MLKCVVTSALLTAVFFTSLASAGPVSKKPQISEIRKLKLELRKQMPAEREVAARDELAKQQAQVAVQILRLGETATAWSLLRHTSDPSLRTYLIHDFATMDVDPGLLIARLLAEKDASVRRALILSLGEFNDEQLPANQRRPLVDRLLRWYREDPDPGIHAAIGWLLRYGKQGDKPRKLDWGQATALSAIDESLAGRRAASRRWYVTSEGQTMVMLRGPLRFQMGSPSYELGRVPASDSPEETLHTKRIPRSFAISSTEVTIGQFQRFLNNNPAVKARFVYRDEPNRMAQVLRTFSPDQDGPQIAVTWYEAAMYCNWLSQREGIPESQWVYPKSFEQIADGMTMPGDYLQRTGYRLPTEAEWEYAARAGSNTSRFFGNSDGMLREYAWYSKNPPRRKGDPADPNDPQRTWPVAQLKPNDFGLFDIYGNVWEWCQDRMRSYQANDLIVDREDAVSLVSDRVARSRRGGAFPYEAAMQRSAERDTKNAFPMLRRDNVGFRVARTYR